VVRRHRDASSAQQSPHPARCRIHFDEEAMQLSISSALHVLLLAAATATSQGADLSASADRAVPKRRAQEPVLIVDGCSVLVHARPGVTYGVLMGEGRASSDADPAGKIVPLALLDGGRMGAEGVARIALTARDLAMVPSIEIVLQAVVLSEDGTLEHSAVTSLWEPIGHEVSEDSSIEPKTPGARRFRDRSSRPARETLGAPRFGRAGGRSQETLGAPRFWRR
jgi:hypothetical protein